MPDRPRPRPVPKAFDVFKPGKTQPSPTSRPVIVGHQPQVQDHMVVEQHGAPVVNAHHSDAAGRAKPVLKSLEPHQAPERKPVTATRSARLDEPMEPIAAPAPSAPVKTDTPTQPEFSSVKKVSRTGHVIARSSAGTSKAPLLHHKVAIPVEHPAAPEVKKPEEPSLAVPITPVEQPASLLNSKTEGKEELLAAMPVEIRRSVANAEGQQAADWNMPAGITDTPEPPVPAPAPQPEQAQVAPAEAVTPAAKPEPQPAEQPAAPPPAAEATEQPQPEQPAASEKAAPAVPMKAASQQSEKRHSDAVVFIIMFVLFLLLTTVVVMLFLSGSISI